MVEKAGPLTYSLKSLVVRLSSAQLLGSLDFLQQIWGHDLHFYDSFSNDVNSQPSWEPLN